MKKYIYIILLTTLLVSCGDKAKDQSTATETLPDEITLTPAQLANVQLHTGKLERRNLSKTTEVNGYIEVPPQNLYSVSTHLSGFVERIEMLPGMNVKKGAILATMGGSAYIQLQRDFLVAKANLSLLEAEYKRQKELLDQQATSEKNYEKAKADWLSTKANYRAMMQELILNHIDPEKLTDETLSSTVNIYAPFNGIVTKVNVNIGQNVNPADVMLEMINIDDIHLTLKIFEQDILDLKINQRLTAYNTAHPEKKYTASIIYIGKNIDKDRTAEVHCHFENYDHSMVPGMYMRAIIEKQNANAYTLPEKAVVSFEDKDYIFVQRSSNQFKMQEVQTGNRDKGWVEVKDATPLLDKSIVTDGAYALLMSLRNSEEE